MFLRRRLLLIVITTIIGAGLLLSVSHLIPLNFFSVQQKPQQQPQKVYDYYIIYDEQTGQDLMYVPLVVSVGDEVLTEDDKLYKIVKVEENRAYARFSEDMSKEVKKRKPNEN